MAKTFKSDEASLDLLNAITEGLDFSIKDVDFSDPAYNPNDGIKNALGQAPDKLTTETITERKVDGRGIFDSFMTAFKVHLKEEYDENRITGAEYTKAYSSLAQVAMQWAVTFALGKDKAYWDGINAQLGAYNSFIANDMAKVQLAIAQAQALKTKAEYALTVAKLATEDAQYALIKENHEATRAQTLDNRSDGQRVVGSVGKQKELYDKQIWAYQREAEQKILSIYNNAWVTEKGVNEDAIAPSEYTRDNINRVISSAKNKVGL